MKRLKHLMPVIEAGEGGDVRPFAEGRAEAMPACETCGDLGHVRPDVPFGHKLWGKLVVCPNPGCRVGREARDRIWNGALKTSGLPRHYRDLTFRTFQQEMDRIDGWAGKSLAFMALKHFVESADYTVDMRQVCQAAGVAWDESRDDRPRNSIMLYGPVGMGKTGLVAAAMNVLLLAGQSVLYARCRDILREIQDRYGAEEYPTASDVLKLFQEAPLLVIDEFGIKKKSDDRLEHIESLIRSREQNGMPTLMTSNLDQEEFRTLWGDATADSAITMAHWIKVYGNKLRSTPSAFQELD